MVQAGSGHKRVNLRTCKQCKQQYDPDENNPRACKYHTAHYGGEGKRDLLGLEVAFELLCLMKAHH
jgi:hypothetical protein